MPFVLETFTLEEQIAATQPTGFHQHTVDMILSDEASDWKNHPFNGNQTIYDYDVTQNHLDLADLEKQKKALEKRIPELQAELAKPAKEGGGRAQTKNLLKDAYSELTFCRLQTAQVEEKLKKFSDLQQVVIKELSALRYITNEYKTNKDREWLAKAVHLACNAALVESGRTPPKDYQPPHDNSAW
jgi:chaperonin cofactor prefoldin